jgi:sedoheptulokinase
MFLGIDIGTSKAAAVVADEGGRLAAAASRDHAAARPAPPGRAEQDPAALLEAAWAAVRDLPADLRRRVRAVGVTGQMHGVVLVDARGEAVSPLVTWQDGRCLEGVFLEDLASRTGHALSTGFGCATLAWLAARGGLPREAAAAATIHDLVVARLCGAAAPVTDPTDAAGWGLFDLSALAWDEAAVAAAGIPARLLPQVRPSGSRAGGVAADAASRLGLAAGTPVAVALGDNQASMLAVLGEPDRELVLTLGTGGQVSAVLPAGAVIGSRTDGATYEYRPYPSGRWAVVAASLCGGAAWAWLADTAAAWAADLGLAGPPRGDLFARLNDLGLAATDEVCVRPHFLGERHAPALRGAVEGIGPGPMDLGRLARGLARGIVANLREMLPGWVLAGRARVVGTGNALRRNPLLQRMAEAEFGLPLVLSEGREEAALGAAMHAARLAGPAAG